jgi:hypothetical protein
MTATEILERKAEFMRVIGPTFGRLEADYTGPMVERAFRVLLRGGGLPAPPSALRGAGVRFEYASPIARAQKQIDAAALGKTVQDLAPLAAQNPSLLDNFDEDRVARDVAEANGLPQHWIRPAAAVAQLRAGRAAAAQAEAKARDAERLAESTAKLGQVPGLAAAVGLSGGEGRP